MESDMSEDAKPLESNATSEVIGYLLADSNQTLVGGGYKPDSPSSLLQNDKDGDSNASDGPIQMTAVALPDGTTTLQLEDGTTAYIQTVNDKVAEAVGALSDGTDLSPKFIDGQAVQLEDGTTAFLHTAPKEGLQAVQLEDGSTAYIASALNLESYDESGATDGGGVPCVLEDPTVPKLELSSVNSLAGTSTVRAPPRLSSKAVALGDKAFRCAYEGCGRLYTTQHHLKVHERAHTGDRPFRCEVDNCNKAFATGYGLKSHTRVHTGEKPYKCVEDYCTKAFKTSGDLQKHVRTHTGERPFKCPYEGCDRSFTTSNIRKVHVRTHTGERPYVCTEENCGRAFASATNYKNHIRIHTGEKPYVCTVRGCGKRFTEYSSLYKHHVVHTHTKPYICSVCGKNYRQTSTLAMHTRTAHGILDPTEEICDEGQVDDPTGESDPESLTDNVDVPKKRPRIQLMVAGADVNDPAAMVALQAAQQAAEQAIQQVQQQQAQLELAAATRATGPQILVVTDPAQFAALQQLAIANSANDVTDDNGLSTEQTVTETEEGSLVAYSVASM